MSPLPQLLKTVFVSITEVSLVALAGFVLARARVLDTRTQRQLTRVNVALFTPCLIVAKVAFALSRDTLRELWVVPLFFVLLSALSAAVAAALAAAARLSRAQRNFAVAAAMFMNTNSLPIALLQSLVGSMPALAWGADDTRAAMLGRALTYLTLCSSLGMVLRWSIGVRLLMASSSARADDSETGSCASDEDTDVEPDERTALLASTELARAAYGLPQTLGRGPGDRTPDALLFARAAPRPPSGASSDDEVLSFVGRPHAPPDASPPSPPLPPPRLPLPLPVPPLPRAPRPSPGAPARLCAALVRAASRLGACMPVPLSASLASIGVALWPALQDALKTHATPVRNAITQLGNCSIPLTLVVLGAYFYEPDDDDAPAAAEPGPGWWRRTRSLFSLRSLYERDRKASFASGPTALFAPAPVDAPVDAPAAGAAQRGEGRTVAVAIAARMLVVPLLGLPLLARAARADTPPVFEDPVFVLSLVFVLCSPPALTLSQMVQAVPDGAFERLVSRTLFWSYCVVTPPATVVSTVVAMLIAKL